MLDSPWSAGQAGAVAAFSDRDRAIFDNGDPYATVAASQTTKAPKHATTTVPPPTTTPLRLPGAIKVLPANGSGVQGAGGRLKDKLTASGYNTLAATNATPTSKVYAT